MNLGPLKDLSKKNSDVKGLLEKKTQGRGKEIY